MGRQPAYLCERAPAPAREGLVFARRDFEVRAAGREGQHRKIMERSCGPDGGLLTWRSSPAVLFLAACLAGAVR